MKMESDCSNEEIDIMSGGQSNFCSFDDHSVYAPTSNRKRGNQPDDVEVAVVTTDHVTYEKPPTQESNFMLQESSSGRIMESPRPGPSGINQSSESEDIKVDSDDSIEIIEVPKKPVPLITLSDSNSDSEIDVVEVDVKPKRTNTGTIRERLEGQKSKIFAVKMEAENGEDSPPNKYDVTCTICLGTYQNRAFLDECFHSFCYTCILQWAKVVHTCPLCKSAFKSVIHNITPDLDYKQEFMNKSNSSATETTSTITFDSWINTGERFRYRTTLTSVGNYISDWYRQRRYESFRTSSSVPHHQRRQRRSWGRRQPSASGPTSAREERRRSVYRHGMVIKEVKHPPGRVKYRDISVQFFKQNPAISHRLVPWILRDLKVLLGHNNNDASFVLHLIMSLLQSYPMDSAEFYNQLLPYLYDNTRQFIRELINFASSPYDMLSYDCRVEYDFQSGARRASTISVPQTASASQSQSNTESEISLRDRLLDEMFAESVDGSSPPYNPSRTHSSPMYGAESPPYNPSCTHSSPMYGAENPTYPSNKQKESGALEDQGWSSNDSIIDVTGTNSIIKASCSIGSTSEVEIISQHDAVNQRRETTRSSRKETKKIRSGDEFSDNRLSDVPKIDISPELDSIFSCSSKDSARIIFDKAQSGISRRHSVSRSKESNGKSRVSKGNSRGINDRPRESSEKSSESNDKSRESNFKFRESNDKSSRESNKRSRESYKKSRKSKSRSRESRGSRESRESRESRGSSSKSRFMSSSHRENNHSDRMKSYTDSRSYTKISQSKSKMRSRSRSRSRDSNNVFNVKESRLREQKRSYRSRSSRSLSKESTELFARKDVKSRSHMKSGRTRSPRSRDSSDQSKSSRRRAKNGKETHVSETLPRSRSTERYRKKVFRRSRSRSMESSCSFNSSRSIKTNGESRCRSSKSRLSKSKSPRSRSTRSQRSRSRSKGKRDSKLRTSRRRKDSQSSTPRSRESSYISETRSRKARKRKHKARKYRSRSKDRSDCSIDSKSEMLRMNARSSNGEKPNRCVYYKEGPKSREASVSETDHNKVDGSEEVSTVTLIQNDLGGESSLRAGGRRFGNDESNRQTKRCGSLAYSPKHVSEASLKGKEFNLDRGILTINSVVVQNERHQALYIDGESLGKPQKPCFKKLNEKDGDARSRASGPHQVKYLSGIGGGRSWGGSENGRQDGKVDGAYGRNDIDAGREAGCHRGVDSGDGIGSQEDGSLSEEVSAQSPEYYPVKILSPIKISKVIKIKRKPLGVKMHDACHPETQAATESRHAIENWEGGEYSNEVSSACSKSREDKLASMAPNRVGNYKDAARRHEAVDSEVYVSNEGVKKSLKQIPYGLVNNVQEDSRGKLGDEISITSNSTETDVLKSSYTGSIASNLDNGRISFHTKDAAKDCLPAVGEDIIICPRTLSANENISEGYHQNMLASSFDNDYLNTIAVIPSLDDDEIEANIRELNHKISLSKETLKDLSR